MKRWLHLFVIAVLALMLSALTLPMMFFARTSEITGEYDTTDAAADALVECTWGLGINMVDGLKGSELTAEILLHAINFCLFFLVLLFLYFVVSLFLKFRKIF